MKNQINRLTLENAFHGTAINLRPRGNRLTFAQVKRARRALCGVRGCTCGGYLAETFVDPPFVDVQPTLTGGAALYDRADDRYV